MSSTMLDRTASLGNRVGFDEGRTCYVINLYTWIQDPTAAADLAILVAETLAGMREIDHYATTVSEEEDPAAPPTRIYVDLRAP